MQTTSNTIKRLSIPARAAGTLAAALLAAWVSWGVVSDTGHVAAGGLPLRPDEVLAAVVAAAVLVGVVWLAVGIVLELLALVPGTLGRAALRVADVVTPVLLRRAVGAVLGLGLVAGLAPGAAVASPLPGVVAAAPLPDPAFAPLPDPGFAPLSDSGSARPRDPASAALPDPGSAPSPDPVSGPPEPPGRGWVPRPPVVRAQPDVRVLTPSPRPGSPTELPEEVVVRRGDSLWSIAARHLGRDASDAEIARAWPAWFEANAAVIGPDPDLLRPGQLLRPPDGPRS